MPKDFKNKIDGIGEKHISYSLQCDNYLSSPRFATKRSLNDWIKENKEWLKEMHLRYPNAIFRITKWTEIYANKTVDILKI